MAYFAEVDPNSKVVKRVIVVANAKLAAELTGTNESDWVETKQNDPNERYAGKGDEYDARLRERFKPRTRAVDVKDEAADATGRQ